VTFLCLVDKERSGILRQVLAAEMPDLPFAEQGDEFEPGTVRFLLTWEQPASLPTMFPNLEILFCIGAGIDHFDLSALPASLRVVRMVESGLTAQMTNYAVMSVLALARDLPFYLRQQREALWMQRPARPIEDLSVGVMGLGHIGRAVLTGLSPFGFRLRAWSRSRRDVEGVECYQGEALDRFLAGTDILICLLPLTAETRGILSAKALAKLPRGAAVINMGRGAHLDQAALVALLDQGRLDAAILDVADPEPLPESHPLWKHPKVVLTPHVAGRTSMTSGAAAIVENLRCYKAGMRLIGEVDRTKGY